MDRKEYDDTLIYYYCSLDTFCKIIQHKTIRLSEIDKSNDSTEIIWIQQFIEDAFNTQFGTEKVENISPVLFSKMLAQSLNDYFGKDRPYTYLATCFSRKEDLLSQWRGYADDGCGMCIGFDKQQLINLNNNNVSNMHGDTFFNPPNNVNPFGYIEYINDDNYRAKPRKWIIKRLGIDLMEKIKTVSVRIPSKPDGNEYGEIKTYVDEIIKLLFYEAPFYKNSGFKEEEEWRLIQMIGKDSIANYQNKGEIIAFAKRDNRIVFYKDLSLKKEPPNEEHPIDIINTIYIGPKCQISETDVILSFKINNFKIEAANIHSSKTSYV